jgi:cytochrome c nitrite reductase small subunit
MSRKRILALMVLLAVVVLGGAGAMGFWQYHERPEFCATCHIMEPYLASWLDSEYGAHGHATEDVTCLECHVPTIEQQINELVVYVQGDYEIPLEELDYPQDQCFQCHEHGSYEEVVQLTADLELNPHDSHFGEVECDTCHNMHGPSADYCAECHGPLTEAPGWTTDVSRPETLDVWYPEMDCASCHVMVPYLESLEDTNLLAYAHVQEGLDCLDCHEEGALEQLHEEAVPGKSIRGKTVEMQFCFDCHMDNEHTSYEQLIGRTEDYVADGQNINPHDPHADVVLGPKNEMYNLGPYECSDCHQMHEESPLTEGCYDCHHSNTFEACSNCH